jgi:hypothetical protein
MIHRAGNEPLAPVLTLISKETPLQWAHSQLSSFCIITLQDPILSLFC